MKSDQPGLIVRRVVGADMPGAPSKYLNVQAAEARYDEIYSDADISFSTKGECSPESFEPAADKRVCVGFNTDCVTGATASLPIFKNQYVDIECSDCFIDFTLDVFFSITIRDFTVRPIANPTTEKLDGYVSGYCFAGPKYQPWVQGHRC